MSPPPAVTLTTPQSPTRARSVSQPIREGVALEFFQNIPPTSHSATLGKSAKNAFLRSQSTSNVTGKSTSTAVNLSPSGPPPVRIPKTRARSSSLVTVTEVGGDEPEVVVDRLGVGTNENAAWVNAPGAWLIHPVMILFTKVLVDLIPHMTQDVSWTVVNLGYMAVSFLMFHHVTGVPFESGLTSSGAYDELTLWEQIDSGAQYTPAKKWLTSVPIGLFLISTHYTKYDYTLFALNFAALVFVLFPKLPVLHRLRFQFLAQEPNTDVPPTPAVTRPPSPTISAGNPVVKTR